MIDLRILTSEDWTVWRELRLRALADAPHAFGSKLKEWENAVANRWRARLDLPDSHNFVAYIAGKPE